MRIGAVAKSVGCHVETVRYYEKVGLIPPASKESNGYGRYTKKHLRLLRLIRHAKDLGFSQDQIRSLSHLAANRDNVCEEVHHLTNDQLTIIDEKMRRLARMKKDLQALARSCENNRQDGCPALQHLLVR